MINRTITWQNYFDRIFCIHFLPHAERLPRLETELKRVGIFDSGIFEYWYTVPTKHDKLLADYALKNKWITQPAYANLSFGTLQMLKRAYLLGMERILVLEDDAVFLKDLSLAKDILDSMPDKYGIIQFDKALDDNIVSKWKENLLKRKLNDWFVESPYNFAFATCNCYSRKGMEEAISVLEERLCTPDRISKFSGKPTAIAIKNLAIQVVYGNACNLKYGDEKWLMKRYDLASVKQEDYAIPVGYSGLI